MLEIEVRWFERTSFTGPESGPGKDCEQRAVPGIRGDRRQQDVSVVKRQRPDLLLSLTLCDGIDTFASLTTKVEGRIRGDDPSSTASVSSDEMLALIRRTLFFDRPRRRCSFRRAFRCRRWISRILSRPRLGST